jgi:DNA polymerase-1
MALAYKAHFAFISRPLRTKSGFPTSAIFGFVTQLLKIIEDLQPDSVIIAFDHHEKTFRHQAFEAYKANREEMPEDLQKQIPKIREIVNALGFPLHILPGYEADDIIGTLSKLATAKGNISYCVTPDKDYVQLVDDSVFIVKPGKSSDPLEIFDSAKVKEVYGFSPEFMIDYLALIGDSSDNVPGVAGIGPKTALPLIQAYGTLENIYAHVEEIASKSVQKKLVDCRDLAFKSKELVTIHTTVPLPPEELAFPAPKPDFDKVKQLFMEFELIMPFTKAQRLLERFTTGNSSGDAKETTVETLAAAASEEPTAEATDVNQSPSATPLLKTFESSRSKYTLITSKEECRNLASLLQKQPAFVFDTETDGLDRQTLTIAGASFCYQEGEAWFVALNPFRESLDLFAADLSDRLAVDDFIEIFKPVFENAAVKKICHNAKFDLGVLRKYGIQTNGFFFDTMIAAYLIDADQLVGMDALSEKYLNYKPIPLSELIGKKKDAKRIFDVPLQQLSDYAAEDAEITYLLYTVLKPLIDEQQLEKVAYAVDFPLVEVLEDMETTGVRIDKAALNQLSKDLELQMQIIADTIFKLAGETFNINSTKQLQTILFEKLGLKATKKTKTGYSTDAQSLENLRGEHEIIEALLTFRQASKLKSTYADALPELISPITGRVHTTYNQTVASTGRLSSIDPNLQNIPIRTELGKEIRKAFVPADKGHIILSADYSQIELRIMASMSGDEGMTEAFIHGEDIHRSTAARVFMTPPSEVTSDMRRKAKEVNFGILYGIGAFGLRTRLGISNQHAKEIIETYFNTFKKVKAFIDLCVEDARQHGYAATLFGRRRYLPNINSSNRLMKQFEERVAVNMPIQGTAADMIKVAMINIHKEMQQRRLKSKMVLQVHDELVFDVLLEELEEMKSLAKELMENALPLNVPVVVEMGTGENWLDAH